jgi:hypothetical protein
MSRKTGAAENDRQCCALAEWERNEVVLALRGRAKLRRGLADNMLADHPEWKGDETPASMLVTQAYLIEVLAQRFAEAQAE